MAVARKQLEYSQRKASNVGLSERHKERLPILNTVYFPWSGSVKMSAYSHSSLLNSFSNVHSTIHCLVTYSHSYKSDNTLSLVTSSAPSHEHTRTCAHMTYFSCTFVTTRSACSGSPHDAMHLPSIQATGDCGRLSKQSVTYLMSSPFLKQARLD